jgi:hypothetical protein
MGLNTDKINTTTCSGQAIVKLEGMKTGRLGVNKIGILSYSSWAGEEFSRFRRGTCSPEHREPAQDSSGLGITTLSLRL